MSDVREDSNGLSVAEFLFRKSNNRSSSEAQSTGSNSPLVSIRLAVCDNFTSEPRIIDMENGDAGDLIARIRACMLNARKTAVVFHLL